MSITRSDPVLGIRRNAIPLDRPSRRFNASLGEGGLQVSRTLALAFSILLVLAGCAAIPKYTSINDEQKLLTKQRAGGFLETGFSKEDDAEYERQSKSVRRASFYSWNEAYSKSDVFVGVAISGGGSRAANFSAAVLEQLEQEGFLPHVTALSSVSGGSLTAAYYALFRNSSEIVWSWKEFRQRLLTDFFAKFRNRFLLYPHNWLRYFFTHYDRSDIMAQVFDDQLFRGKTFAYLGGDDRGPRLFINATDLLDGARRRFGSSAAASSQLGLESPVQPFVFTEDEFEGVLASRLDTYPIAHAVMASAAFPLVFQNVTLRNFSTIHTFSRSDLIDPGRFALAVRDSDDIVSSFVRKRVDVTTWRLFTEYNGGGEPPDRLTQGILDTLNRVVWDSMNVQLGNLLLDKPDRYSQQLLAKDIVSAVRQHPETARKLRVDPEKLETQIARGRVARMILERAYAGQLRPERNTYVHLFDGGAADNLGLVTLEYAARSFYRHAPGGRKPRGCFIFLVDSNQGRLPHHRRYDPDTRRFFDFIADRNAMDAVDAMLRGQRGRYLPSETDFQAQLERWTSARLIQTMTPRIWRLRLIEAVPEGPECLVWHIGFDRLSTLRWLTKPDQSEEVKAVTRHSIEQLEDIVSNIGTHFRLVGPQGCSEAFLQDRLYEAGKLLVSFDDHPLNAAREWFDEHGLRLNDSADASSTWNPLLLPYVRDEVSPYCPEHLVEQGQ